MPRNCREGQAGGRGRQRCRQCSGGGRALASVTVAEFSDEFLVGGVDGKAGEKLGGAPVQQCGGDIGGVFKLPMEHGEPFTLAKYPEQGYRVESRMSAGGGSCRHQGERVIVEGPHADVLWQRIEHPGGFGFRCHDMDVFETS